MLGVSRTAQPLGDGTQMLTAIRLRSGPSKSAASPCGVASSGGRNEKLTAELVPPAVQTSAMRPPLRQRLRTVVNSELPLLSVTLSGPVGMAMSVSAHDSL